MARTFGSLYSPSRLPCRRTLMKRMAVAAVTAAAALGTGCAAQRDTLTTGGIPDDYRQRHPIVVTQAEQTVDLPVSTTDRRLTLAQKDTVRGFAQTYISRASGPVYLMTPVGSANARAAGELRGQIRGELSARGVPSSKIINSSYQAVGPHDAAPIRLSFTGMTAVTSQCGQWPKSIAPDLTNQNYFNFGCATQNNLAAQVANPEDLVAPRGVTPIDAQRRADALKEYREYRTVLKDSSSDANGF